MKRPLRFGRHRYHHGLHGCVILGVGVCQGSPWLVLAGATLIAHDLSDRRSWLRDLVAHPGWRNA